VYFSLRLRAHLRTSLYLATRRAARSARATARASAKTPGWRERAGAAEPSAANAPGNNGAVEKEPRFPRFAKGADDAPTATVEYVL
jgi:hypothetical protein